METPKNKVKPNILSAQAIKVVMKRMKKDPSVAIEKKLTSIDNRIDKLNVSRLKKTSRETT